uniref:Uncharacterized protein n=1 Tax=Anguilla anguilla TaxID=7936 RepID=A0A0E9VM86_ANGAN
MCGQFQLQGKHQLLWR